MKFSEALYDVVEHYTKTSRDSWMSIMDSDSARDWSTRGRGQRNKMEAERECGEIIQGMRLSNLNPF